MNIIGAIDADNYSVFCQEMHEFEKTPGKKISIHLCSEGGDTYIGLAFYARIRSSPCEIAVVAFGQVMSAATIILAAGDERLMDKDAWFMVHDDDTRVRESNSVIANNQFEHHEALEKQWAEILSRHSLIGKENWRELSRNTTYMSAYECKANGIVDELV